MRTTKAILVLSALAALLAVFAGCGGKPEKHSGLPSYRAAVNEFQSARKPAALSDADKQVMQQAADTLAGQMPSPGLKVGDKAPGFALPNAFGKAVSLAAQLERGPVILVFYRGAWCPYCNLHLRSLQESLPRFQAYGAGLVAITPQQPDRSREQIEKDAYQFEILSDLDGSAMRAYRLHFDVPAALTEVYKSNFKLDIADYNGPGRYELPAPATFVIGQDGVIRAAFAHTDYKLRMEPTDILDALEAATRR